MKYLENKTTVLTHDLLDEIMTHKGLPCISLYQSTHRQFPNNKQDSIRFNNLVKELEVSLSKEYNDSEMRKLLKPYEELSRDTEFWNHTLDGLVILSSPDFFRILILPQAVNELVMSGDSFYVKPLWRYLQSLDHYQVLAISRDKIRFFEGNRHELDELEIEGVPHSIKEALDTSYSSSKDDSSGVVNSKKTPLHHGYGDKGEQVDNDTERFFRLVDEAVIEHYSRPSNLPLFLAALPEHHHLFHQVSKNKLLVAEGINIDPFSISTEQLKELVWESLKPQYLEKLNTLSNKFEEAQAGGLGSDDLVDVSNAAAAGRIDTLLIQKNIDDQTIDDKLDDLGEQVMKMGGHVFVVPMEKMPSDKGLAATFRY